MLVYWAITQQAMDDFTRVCEVRYWKSGLLEVVREQVYPTVCNPPPQRAESRRWSKKSRRRLIALIAKSEVKMSSMITLTFPESCRINDGKVAKKILNRFLVKLRRGWPDVEYWWVLEFQKNGQPHFHILTSIDEKGINRPKLGREWAQSILYKAPEGWVKHRLLFADISSVHSHKSAWISFRLSDGAQRYLLKYVNKEAQKKPPDAYKNIGRWWGCSKGLRGDTPPSEEWPIDEHGLREVLKAWGMDWVASWDYLPKYIHVVPIDEGVTVE